MYSPGPICTIFPPTSNSANKTATRRAVSPVRTTKSSIDRGSATSSSRTLARSKARAGESDNRLISSEAPRPTRCDGPSSSTRLLDWVTSPEATRQEDQQSLPALAILVSSKKSCTVSRGSRAGKAPSYSRRLHPLWFSTSNGPGTAKTGRPRQAASAAVYIAPLVRDPSATSTASPSAASRRLR